MVIALAAALLLAGCGQKGGLYRPEPEELQPGATAQPVPASARAAPHKD
jgi:predicted small lipoprotein YifL